MAGTATATSRMRHQHRCWRQEQSGTRDQGKFAAGRQKLGSQAHLGHHGHHGHVLLGVVVVVRVVHAHGHTAHGGSVHHQAAAQREVSAAGHSDGRARRHAHLARGVGEEAQRTAAVGTVAAKLGAVPAVCNWRARSIKMMAECQDGNSSGGNVARALRGQLWGCMMNQRTTRLAMNAYSPNKNLNLPSGMQPLFKDVVAEAAGVATDASARLQA